MNVITRNWKSFLVVLALLGAAGCQTQEPKEEAPAAESPAAVTEAAPATEAGETYTVVRGDHLWGIAGQSRIYGNPYQWPLLYKANADTIEDADLIKPGQVLNVARGQSQSEIDTAIHHAKTRGAWSLGVTEASDKAYLGR